jgi:hypothetical protein
MNQPNVMVRVDSTLLFDFFLTFARMEFALKNAGFVIGDEDSVNPAWDAFGNAIKDRFKRKKTKELDMAVDYILINPPMKQVLRRGNLMWDTNLPNAGSETQTLLVLIRRIRNNLFHGGKHNFGVHENTERTTQLLKNSLLIIQECSSLLPDVKTNYDEAAI